MGSFWFGALAILFLEIQLLYCEKPSQGGKATWRRIEIFQFAALANGQQQLLTM